MVYSEISSSVAPQRGKLQKNSQFMKSDFKKMKPLKLIYQNYIVFKLWCNHSKMSCCIKLGMSRIQIIYAT